MLLFEQKFKEFLKEESDREDTRSMIQNYVNALAKDTLEGEVPLASIQTMKKFEEWIKTNKHKDNNGNLVKISNKSDLERADPIVKDNIRREYNEFLTSEWSETNRDAKDIANGYGVDLSPITSNEKEIDPYYRSQRMQRLYRFLSEKGLTYQAPKSRTSSKKSKGEGEFGDSWHEDLLSDLRNDGDNAIKTFQKALGSKRTGLSKDLKKSVLDAKEDGRLPDAAFNFIEMEVKPFNKDADLQGIADMFLSKIDKL